MLKTRLRLVMLMAALLPLLTQRGESADKPDADGTGRFLLAICGNYTGDDTPTVATGACLAYVAGLADAIGHYEVRLEMFRAFDVLTHAGFYARVGELPTELLQKLRNPLGAGIIRLQDEAIARGVARSTPVFAGTNPMFSVVRRAVCFPEGLSSTGQLALVIVKFVRDHPERLHEDRRVLAFAALESAFPCPREEEEDVVRPDQPPVDRRP